MDWRQDSEQTKADFDRDGYVVIRGFVDSDRVADIHVNVKRFIDDVVPGLRETAAKYEVQGNKETLMRLSDMAVDDYFKRLNHRDHFVKLAETLLEDGVVQGNLQFFNKPPRHGGITPPHQDGFYFMRQPNEALTMWLALDKVDDENGCIRYLPGSHKEGFRPHKRQDRTGFSQGVTDYGDEELEREHAVHASPGDVLIHHAMIVHRADPNPSDRTRRAMGLIYYARSAKEDREWGKAEQERLQTQWEKEGKI